MEVGAIIEGRITKITKFGAFVSLPGGKAGWYISLKSLTPMSTMCMTTYRKGRR